MKDELSGKGVLDESSKKNETEGVKTLFGDPKKAIIKLSFPMIVAMSVQMIYNVVDSIWVSGLGADPLAAIGFVFPFFFVIMALSNGLGVGAGAAISRRIGARDKEGADNVAVQTMIMMVLVAIGSTIPLFVFAEDIFTLIGAGRTVGLAVAYGRIIFAGSILLFFTNIANSILRAEGDSKRAMYAMILGAGLNIILDPIFIYTFDMGIEGAAWATLVSLGISSIIMFNWLFFRKNTYVSFDFSDLRYDRSILRDIFSVGLPASVQQLSMALTMLVMNIIIVMVSNTDGVAVYSAGWRVVTIAIAPLMGISTAVVSITGASFGELSFKKAEIAHLYATKIGFIIGSSLAVLTFILAPQIAALFTQTQAGAHIGPDLIDFLRIVCIFYPMVSFGMMASSYFQGAGKGMNALVATILRTIVMTPLFGFIFAFNLDLGLNGVWWGIVTGNMIGSVVVFAWVRFYTARIMRTEYLQGVDPVSFDP